MPRSKRVFTDAVISVAACGGQGAPSEIIEGAARFQGVFLTSIDDGRCLLASFQRYNGRIDLLLQSSLSMTDILSSNIAHKLASHAINGDIAGIANRLSLGADPNASPPVALRCVARNGQFAARHGRSESFGTHLPASAPLIEIEGILSEAIDFGHAQILSIMRSHERRLIDSIDLPAAIFKANGAGRSGVAAILSTAADKRLFEASLSQASERNPCRAFNGASRHPVDRSSPPPPHCRSLATPP